MKLKLLTLSESEEVIASLSKDENLNSKDMSKIISMLEMNHDYLEDILIKEEEYENMILRRKSRSRDEKSMPEENEDEYKIMLVSQLFTAKPKFMDYLFKKMLNVPQQKMSNSDVSLLLLNMFKTLIDNNSNILKITQ